MQRPRRRMSHRVKQLDFLSRIPKNRQGFSHREADEKSLLDEAFRREMGERGRANGDRSVRSDRSISLGPRR